VCHVKEDAASLRINTDVEAFNTHRQVSATSMTLSTSMERSQCAERRVVDPVHGGCAERGSRDHVRVRELAAQFDNGTLSQADRAAITVEVGR
jgi:hypothetical protein